MMNKKLNPNPLAEGETEDLVQGFANVEKEVGTFCGKNIDF